MKPSFVTAIPALVLLVIATQDASLVAAGRGPSVIIVGAGMSGISAGRHLWDAGVRDLTILEGTDRVGGRIHKHNFRGINVETGANRVVGVNGKKINPIWTMVNSILKLRNFRTNFTGVVSNVYKDNNDEDVYTKEFVQKRMNLADEVEEQGTKLAARMNPSGREDISILTMQRLFNYQPIGKTRSVDMALDYFRYDYEFAEPPRITSLQNTQPTATSTDFGEDAHFIADQRGFESLVYDIARQYLETDKSGNIRDLKLKLNTTVWNISYDETGVTVRTHGYDSRRFKADYVIVSTSLGVLQSELITFSPQLPDWKIIAIYRFDMAVYTKIFLKFPRKFWPTEKEEQFFLYASERRGYYGVWQSFEQEYPGANVLMVTVTDEESRRIEQQPDSTTMAEAMAVLRKMFHGKDVPDATEIYVPRWWSNRFFMGSYSNWPIGVTSHEYNQLRAPVGRVYFTGEHTSERYHGSVHGAYLAGIDSANILLNDLSKKTHFINRTFNNVDLKVGPKHDDQVAEAKI